MLHDEWLSGPLRTDKKLGSNAVGKKVYNQKQIYSIPWAKQKKRNWLGLKPMHKKKLCEENRRFLANWDVELCWTETTVHEQEKLLGNEALELRHNISVSQVSHSTGTSS